MNTPAPPKPFPTDGYRQDELDRRQDTLGPVAFVIALAALAWRCC